MFGKIKRTWNEARGSVLRSDLEDLRTRLPRQGEEVVQKCSQTMVDGFRSALDKYGPLSNISNDAKKTIAKQLQEEAKNCYNFNIGRKYLF